jgi:hypothetical protein
VPIVGYAAAAEDAIAWTTLVDLTLRVRIHLAERDAYGGASAPELVDLTLRVRIHLAERDVYGIWWQTLRHTQTSRVWQGLRSQVFSVVTVARRTC